MRWEHNNIRVVCTLASIQMVCVIQPSLPCLQQSLKSGKILEVNGGMEENNESLLTIEKKIQYFCIFSVTVMLFYLCGIGLEE